MSEHPESTPEQLAAETAEVIRQIERWLPLCPDCGGNCSPECGMHPAGCVYGGFGRGFWIIAKGCPLSHGEETGGK